jgi:Fanconi anemia group M protein
LGSVFDQRIFRQLKDLKESFEKPILIIEGYDLYSERSVHPNAVRGALGCIAIDYAIPILWTETPEETAAILYWIARREQVEEERSLSIRGQTRAKTLREQQEFLVAGLPGINTKRAKRLLEKFGTPEKVFRASEERLKKVDGIGEVMAKNLRKVLGEKYK